MGSRRQWCIIITIYRYMLIPKYNMWHAHCKLVPHILVMCWSWLTYQANISYYKERGPNDMKYLNNRRPTVKQLKILCPLISYTKTLNTFLHLFTWKITKIVIYFRAKKTLKWGEERSDNVSWTNLSKFPLLSKVFLVPIDFWSVLKNYALLAWHKKQICLVQV